VLSKNLVRRRRWAAEQHRRLGVDGVAATAVGAVACAVELKNKNNNNKVVL
jgi:hypothetical protein